VENKKELNIKPDEYLDLFKKAMKKLAMAVDKEMGEERYLIYFEQLHVYQIEEIQAAVDQAIHDEQYNVIPAVGKLIRIIEDAREERSERWPVLKLEHFEDWPTISDERLKELVRPFYEKLDKQKKEFSTGEREARAEENKKILRQQAKLINLNRTEE
jgi:hypothetical protein